MTFKPERADARDKFAVHTDGKFPLTAIAGSWNPVVIWYQVNGGVPDAARLHEALKTFQWRGKATRASKGAVMLTTPMDGVYLEVIPDDNSTLHRLGFSISGTLQEAYYAEVSDVAEARFPGHGELSRRMFSEEAVIRNAAFAEAKARRGMAPLPLTFEPVVRNGIEQALKTTITALSEAFVAIPADVVEEGLDDAKQARFSHFIEAVFLREKDSDPTVSLSSPAP